MRLVVTGYNRPAYMRQVIRSWSAVRGIAGIHTEFHLEPGQPEVREACVSAPFPSSVHVARERLGVQRNPWKALGTGFASSEFVILGEDDMIVGEDTLEYFAWASREFRDRSDVLAVSAARDRAGGGPAGAVSLAGRFPGWVWGTWWDRWEKIGPDWTFAYENRGWDHRLSDHWCGCLGYKVAQPHLSRAQHIGRDGGTHCTPEMFPRLESRCFLPDAPPQQYFLA